MVSVVAAVVFVCFSVVHTVIIQGPEQWSILLIEGGIDVVVFAVVVADDYNLLLCCFSSSCS